MTKHSKDSPGAPVVEAHQHGADCEHEHEAAVPFVRQTAKVGRNDLCPCGSGKKHKKCCG